MFLLGQEIINGVGEFTGDLQIGLGAFIEKNLPPFSSAYPENNCRTKGEECDQPYSFIHKVRKLFIHILFHKNQDELNSYSYHM